MKKLMAGVFFTFSLMAMAGDYDYIEDRIELKYSILKDSKNNILKIDDVDVEIFNNKIFLNMEIEAIAGDGGWKKFDKSSYDKLAKQIAQDIREMLNTDEKVEITLILDKEVGKDTILENNVY